MTTLKKAMVLAAGMGKRMRPLTDELPKPLVPLAGRPLLDHVLDRIASSGIEEAVVNVHYLASKIEGHLAKRQRPRITISDERGELLETGGGVVKALPLLGQEAFLIHNSDSVWIEGVGSNLVRLMDTWDDRRMDALMLLGIGATSLGYNGHGDFSMEPNGLLSRRSEHRESPFVFTGVSIAHPRLFEGAPKGSFSLNIVWDRAIERGRLYGVRLDGMWMHVGTREALQDAEAVLADASTG
jgi:N-acetyl-alpha-D-muramate 1-phosphate uridylyltransferase